MLVSWMNSRGGTTKNSVVMGVFNDVTKMPIVDDAVLKKMLTTL